MKEDEGRKRGREKEGLWVKLNSIFCLNHLMPLRESQSVQYCEHYVT